MLDGKYVLRSVIGRGRFGTVFEARHVALQKPVAVKVLHDGPHLAADAFLRFRTEAEALGRLAHPHVVAVTDFGVDPQDGGVPYLVMALVAGGPLHDRVDAAPPVPLATAAAWVAQIASALDHARLRGVAHGDLTLRNVLASDAGSAAHLTVVDFGLAHLAAPTAAVADDEDDSLVGSRLEARWAATLEYCAPERLRGRPPSPEADVYGLAVLAYRLLTGHFPFAGPPRAIALAQLTDAPPTAASRLPSVPAAVSDALAAGLAKDPQLRPTALELSAQLTAAARAEARAAWRRREGPRRLAVAAIVTLAAVAIGWWVTPRAVVERLEGATEDARFAALPARAPDARLLLVTIDEVTLGNDARPLALRADEFATGLQRAFAAGAAAVAIDLLLPESWGRSPPFADLVLQHAHRLVLALFSDGTSVVGPEAIDPLVAGALGPEATSRLFALATSVPAADGVVRRVRTAVPDAMGAPRPTLAGRLAALAAREPARVIDAGAGVAVDYAIDVRDLPRTSWPDFVAALDAGTRFDGRLILLGAEYAGSGDRHRVPQPRRWPIETSGLTLQGLLANTLLQGARLREATPGWTWTGAAAMTVVAVFGVLWLPRRIVLPFLGALLAAGLLLGPLAMRAGRMVEMAAPLLAWVVAVGVGAGVRTALPERPE